MGSNTIKIFLVTEMIKNLLERRFSASFVVVHLNLNHDLWMPLSLYFLINSKIDKTC